MVRKRLCIFLLALALTVSLAACKTNDPSPTEASTAGKETVITIVRGEGVYTVDTEKCTITFGEYTYGYKYEGTKSDYKATFTYPNGQTATWDNDIGSGYTWVDSTYTDSYHLLIALQNALFPQPPVTHVKSKIASSTWLSVLLIGIGALFVAFPEPMARGKFYWWVKNPEPSAFAIAVYVILGIFCILVGVLTLLN